MCLKKSYTLPFSVPLVYSAWVSSDTVIAPATKMDVLPEVGGHYRLFMETPEFSTRNEGVFSLVEPERRLKYSWEWDRDGEVTQIDVTFTAVDEGTRIDLDHSGFNSGESAIRHDSGWDSYIEGLRKFLSA